MERLIGENFDTNGIRQRWYADENENVTVEYHQDAQEAADLVQTVNAEGAPTHDGLGKPVAELPQVIWMNWCMLRGLDWTKLISTHELDDEFMKCVREHRRFQYANKKSVHVVS